MVVQKPATARELANKLRSEADWYVRTFYKEIPSKIWRARRFTKEMDMQNQRSAYSIWLYTYDGALELHRLLQPQLDLG